MGRTKTSGFQLAIFDKPPYYEHEVITNLEELSMTSSKSAGDLNKNFQNISNTLNNASNNIVSSIENESEKIRIQSAIENEKIVSGISETNYKLLDVANGISGLDDTIYRSGMILEDAIAKSSHKIVEKLEKGNYELNFISNKLSVTNLELGIISNKLSLLTDIVNKAFTTISSQLDDLITMISSPNETEALELTNQARQNIMLNKKEMALEVTEKALKLSHGTSITVLAYHILALSLFEDEQSIKRMREYYNDFVDLIGFKLTDSHSDSRVVLQEIDSTVYSIMAVMGHKLNNDVMLTTQNLYKHLIKAKSKTYSILEKPLKDKNTLEMISHVNNLRELHWSVLLKNSVVTSGDMSLFIKFVISLMQSQVLTKNEMLYVVSSEFYKKDFLRSIIKSKEIKYKKGVIDTLEIISSALPKETLNANKLILKEINKLINSLDYINFLYKSNITNKEELIVVIAKKICNEGLFYSAIIDALAGNRDGILNEALKIIITLLPHDGFYMSHKTYWAIKLYSDVFKIKINTSLESKFVEASEYIKADIEKNHIVLFDNLQQEMYKTKEDLENQRKEAKKNLADTSKKKMEEFKEHNNLIEDKGFQSKINQSREQIKKLKERKYDLLAPVSGFILGSILSFFAFVKIWNSIPAISIFMDNHLHQSLGAIIGLFIVLPSTAIVPILILIYVTQFISKTISEAQKESDRKLINKLNNEILDYNDELKRKYDLPIEEKKIDSKYQKQISYLTNEIRINKLQKNNKLTANFNLIINKYMPSEIEQLLKSNQQIKEYIKRIFLSKFLSKPSLLEE